jgi:hypothetical protein
MEANDIIRELDAVGVLVVFVITALVEISLSIYESQGTNLGVAELEAQAQIVKLKRDKNKVLAPVEYERILLLNHQTCCNLQLDAVSGFVAVTKLERQILKLEKSMEGLAGKNLTLRPQSISELTHTR